MEPSVEMEQRLLQEGLCLEACSSERMALLWRLFVEKENSAKALAQEILDLRVERAAEINTVQQYVENIRILSKTRDSMALDLEHENEMLLKKLDELKLLQEAQRSEIVEMLLQEDLAEVISCSPSEQVAYLLAERSSLLEKQQDLDGGDTNIPHPNRSLKAIQGSGETPDKVAPLQGQSPWKKLLGLRKASQTKQIFTPVCSQSGENALKVREWHLLERDVAEATNRLDMAHKEIRRLTEELESVRLTLSAYEPELQAAQQEVEQLRQEAESLKHHGETQLRKAVEANEVLEAEVCFLRDTMHKMNTGQLQLLELSQILSTSSLSKVKEKNEENDIHKRCHEELEERDRGLQDLRQIVLNLQAELAEETVQRKKAVEECNEQKKRREEAEDRTLQLQELQEQKDSDHEAEVQHFQEELEAVNAKLSQVKSDLHQEKEQSRLQDLAVQIHAEGARALIQSQEVKLQESRAQCNQLSEELQSTQDLLRNSQEQLLIQTERNSQLHSNVTFLQQKNQKMSAEIVEGQAKVKQLEENAASQCAELQGSQQSLQTCQTMWEQDKSPFQQAQEELTFSRARVCSMVEEIQHLQQLLKSTTQQLRAEETRSAQSTRLEQQVKDMVAEMSLLKIQAEKSQQQRKRLAEREEELQEEVQSLLPSNAQLSLAKVELSQQVQGIENKEINELRQVIKNLNEKLSLSQQDCEKLRTQLQQADFNLSFQISKYHDRKVRHKERLGEAKEVYLRETAWRDEEIKEQKRELEILAKRLSRESDMVKKVQAENDVLLLNKKELLCQLNEEEEASLHAAATVTFMQQRLDHLEKDNICQRDANMKKYTQIKTLERQLHDIQYLKGSEDLKRLIFFKNQMSQGMV